MISAVTSRITTSLTTFVPYAPMWMPTSDPRNSNRVSLKSTIPSYA